tara:strand:+ start:85 stop:459 length:375 start_codon:yes stop_codon:yes gene_type:complete
MTKVIELKLTDDQYDLLSRIAKEDKRRLNDLFYLLFGEGIKYFYIENGISIKKKPNEYTEEENKQLAKNKELEQEEGFNSLSYEEKALKGYKHVCSWMGNFDEGESFIDKLASDVTNNAFKTDV